MHGTLRTHIIIFADAEFDILRFHIKRIPALLTLALPPGDGRPNV